MEMRDLNPVEGTKEKPIFQLSATESASNWLLATRLQRKIQNGNDAAKEELETMEKHKMKIKE